MEGEDGVFHCRDRLSEKPSGFRFPSYFPKPLVSLGTDGFGRSDTREALRDFFEVDYRHIAIAALHELAREGRIDEETVSEAISEFGIDRGKPNPAVT